MLNGITYLNNALAGPPLLSVTDAMKQSISSWSLHGPLWEESISDIVAIKEGFAKLIGARASDIAIVPSVSAGLVAIASSLKLTGKRKNAVVSSLNFSTNKVIWQRMKNKGLLNDVILLEPVNGEVTVESYENAINDSTALVSVDYVSGFNGFVERIKEISKIAHDHEALLVVDAFHAVSALPVNVKTLAIDVLLAGFSKWMCGPPGAACLYVDGKLLGKLDPSYIGWQGIEGNIIERKLEGRGLFDAPFQSAPSKTASRFEWGTWSPVVLKGVREAIKFILNSNLPKRYATIKKRKGQVADGLEKLGLEIITPKDSIDKGGGIVAFKIAKEKEFAKKLAAKNVIVAANFGRVVASPHFYNSEDDVDRFLELTRSYSRR
jgi:selenocysteine lyase/cysteine desulfurase